MQAERARELAVRLMSSHGLQDWTLVFDNARTRAGVCRAARREIGLSRVLTALHDEAEVLDTILHEIAHALVGPAHGHDAIWRAKARQIGCTGQRCVPAEAARAPAAWEGTCPRGHLTTRHRAPTRVQSCKRCSRSFDPDAVFTWTLRGRQVPMHRSYAEELARLTTAGRDAAYAGAAGSPRRDDEVGPVPAAPVLPVGSRVRLLGGGKYSGVVGVIEKRGRTRYHVRTRHGLITAPFPVVAAA